MTLDCHRSGVRPQAWHDHRRRRPSLRRPWTAPAARRVPWPPPAARQRSTRCTRSA